MAKKIYTAFILTFLFVNCNAINGYKPVTLSQEDLQNTNIGAFSDSNSMEQLLVFNQLQENGDKYLMACAADYDGKKRYISSPSPWGVYYKKVGKGDYDIIVNMAEFMNSIMNFNGQTIIDPSSEYSGTRPQYSMFSDLPVIRADTKDTPPYSIIVEMVLGYDLNNTTAATELTSRLVELQDFIYNYFSNKYNADLQSDKEEQLKQDLIEKLNQRLNTAKVRAVFFKQLSTMEM